LSFVPENIINIIYHGPLLLILIDDKSAERFWYLDRLHVENSLSLFRALGAEEVGLLWVFSITLDACVSRFSIWIFIILMLFYQDHQMFSSDFTPHYLQLQPLLTNFGYQNIISRM
jgi:hypothetical protein